MTVKQLIRLLQEFDPNVEVKVMVDDSPASIEGLCADEESIYLWGDSNEPR